MKNIESDKLIGEKIRYLSGFMLPERVKILREVLDRRTRYMSVCMENTFHPQNASALVRHCDAFGIQDVYTIEELCHFRPNVNIVKGTDKWITFHRSRTTSEALSTMRDKGYRIVATSPHVLDCAPENFDIKAGPFVLVFGTEHEGISGQVKEAADSFIRIPMWGFVDSLNVSASAAILLYILSQRLRSGSVEWSLTDTEKDILLYEWMKKTVRDSDGILSRGGYL